MNAEITVVIPLYNKEREIARALGSAVRQTLPPREIIVVDDGSTDNSAAVVADFAAREAGGGLIRLIRQENRGVSAARNRAIREARTPWVALLDGDDEWLPDYLTAIDRLIGRYPGCGAYATAFRIRTGDRLTDARTPEREGEVDFFAESLLRYVLIPSAATLDRALVLESGGFPEGMRMGEDQYLWTVLARRAKVAFSPERLVLYARTASNRSAALWRPEQCAASLEALCDPAASEASNEYVARVALGKGLHVSCGGDTEGARRTLATFRTTRANRFAWRKLWAVNHLPAAWRAPLLGLYNRLAWLLARRGL